MKQKIKCKKCGLLIDSDMETCPYCGYKQETTEETVQNKETVTETKSEKKEKIHFFDFPSRCVDVSIAKTIPLFLIGLFGLQIIQTIFILICSYLPNLGYINNSLAFTASINFACYLILFGIFLIIINKDITKILSEFKQMDTYIQGIGFGFFMMIVSSAVTLLMNLISPQGPNANEQSVEAVTSAYPLLSLLVFGFIGPICEEFTYRVGLFSSLKKFNRIVAYLGTALVFGFIHFNFSAIGQEAIISELINIPSYIVSGLLLCYFYEFGGIGASILAHVTNNFIAVMLQILMGIL